MKLSAPLFQLKRRAKLMARKSKMPLHDALDRVAQGEGFARWSLLSSQVAAATLSETLLARLDDGDLFLMAGRPGHGKTALGLTLLLDAVRQGRKAFFFTLEFTETEARKHLRSLDNPSDPVGDAVAIVPYDEISADYIVRYLKAPEPGSVAVVDYLQILDQQRGKPPLAEQIETLSTFARATGIVLGFISQIDRSFDAQSKRLPDIGDLRLPNAVDLGLFDKACFLHNGEAQLQRVA